MSHNPDLTTERRAQIIAAALACFARKGYVHTTLDDIVAASGLSKGSLYWYFKSKDEIFKAAVAATAATMVGEQWDQLQTIETATGKLTAAAQFMIDFCQEIAQYFGLVLEFWSQSERRDEEMRFWAEMLSPYQQKLAALFKEGAQTGEFRAADADALAWVMLSAYDGLAIYSMMMPEINIAEVSKAFIDTLLKGLQADV
jgi:AcrR family transcriptional regulator